MASGWGSRPNGHHYPSGPPSQNSGPLPICFKCGCEGHYVVNCPRGGSSTQDVSYPHASPPNGYGAGNGSAPQEAQWSNHQNGAPAGHYSHPQSAPPMTRYPPSGQPPEYGIPQGPYMLPVSASSYQQYPGPAPPAQNYPPPHHGPYQPPPNQQYGSSGVYGQNQPPQQAYGAPPPNPQYGNQGYNDQPYGQYAPPTGPPQFANPGYQNPPQQYGPPPAASPYQQPPNLYPPQAAYGPPQQQPQPPQWNNTPPVPYGPPQFQQPNPSNRLQYNSNPRRNPTGPPRQKFQSEQSHHREHGSQSSRSSSQTRSGFNNRHQPGSIGAPGGISNQNANGSAGGPQTRRSSVSSSTQQSQTGDISRPSSNADKRSTKQKNGQSKQVEDSEVHEDPADEEFNWELEMVFKETPPTENVALAQPLSTTFDMTPVPLLYPGSNPSISRYARKDNLKDFIQPIRSQPQWSYLQEDPAFSNAPLDGELIPLHDVPEWMAKRQGIDLQSISTRKREHPDEGHHRYPESATTIEPLAQSSDGSVPTKRRKVEDVDQEMANASTVEAQPTAPGTPTLPRTGTPCLDTEDDVWAPQPGEGAVSAPVGEDPTEALLASLGVTGSPKPVRKRSVPHEELKLLHGKRPRTLPPHPRTAHPEQKSLPPQQQSGNGVPNNHPVPYNGLAHANPGYNMSPQDSTPYDIHQHGMPRQDSYGNGMSPQSNQPPNNAPYPMAPNPQYHNGPHYGNAPYGMQQHTPNGDQPAIPPQNDGLPHFQDPWVAPQQRNHYAPQAHGLPHHTNGSHPTVPQAPYGNVIPAQGNPSHGSPAHSASAHGRPAHPPYNNSSQDSQLQRRSSNSNRRESGSRARPSRGHLDSVEDTPSPSEQTPVLSECQNRKASDAMEPDESPLTPTSAEILGKLIQPTHKASNDKKADDTTRRLRRPQPVVAEAYGRRW